MQISEQIHLLNRIGVADSAIIPSCYCSVCIVALFLLLSQTSLPSLRRSIYSLSLTLSRKFHRLYEKPVNFMQVELIKKGNRISVMIIEKRFVLQP